MQDTKIEYSINQAELLQIAEHLLACDNAFIPALSTHLNIHQYSQKIIEYATRFEAFSNNQLVGLIACYMNDYKNQLGFITNVSIDGKFIGKGIAKQLLKMLLHYAVEKNFKTICLKVNKLNSPALSLYKSAGFTVIKQKQGFYEMKFKLNNIL